MGVRGGSAEGRRKSIHTKGTAHAKGSKGVLQNLGVGGGWPGGLDYSESEVGVLQGTGF